MAIRTVVVDDEEPARNELCFLLECLEDVEVVGQASNGVEALALIEELRPELVLLDIQMPGLTGFEVARQLAGRGAEPGIVFVTAYDQHAIEAFDVNAVDYVLKPVEPGRLEQAIDRARRQLPLGRGDTAEGTEPGGSGRALRGAEIERLVEYVAKRQGQRDRLAVTVGDRFLLVPSDDMIYASLADDVITIVTSALTGTSNYRTLDELHSHLDPEAFWRVHRSHLVNINMIREILPWFSRNYILKMKDANATEIPVSRSQTKRLRVYLNL
jgi:two-component system response regulator LytT